MTYTLHKGDCLEVLKTIPSNSVDSVVTDPPYGLSFMGKKWDYDVPAVEVWQECLRVLKPGGHLLAFAGTRTQHRMAVRIEDAGFEIRDMIAWVYASGFPKSRNLKDEWQGWGTALKPALEPITVARKPLVGTVAENVLEHGTGAINVDGCRVEAPDGVPKFTHRAENSANCFGDGKNGSNRTGEMDTSTGRWPANLIHDGSEEVMERFPVTSSGTIAPHHQRKTNGGNGKTHGLMAGVLGASFGDTGSAARFFYCAKASKKDRDEGCEGMPDKEWKQEGACVPEREKRPFIPSKNNHPTVKPTDLMRYLCRLVTQPGGTVLDPFTGSGSTGKAAMLEGFRFIGIEREAEYFAIAQARIDAAINHGRLL